MNKRLKRSPESYKFGYGREEKRFDGTMLRESVNMRDTTNIKQNRETTRRISDTNDKSTYIGKRQRE